MSVDNPRATDAISALSWRAEVRETHSAVVLLLGERAYKIKKPVDLGFLDFRTEASRRRVCGRELELNRRLAPDVYLDVISVRGSSGADYEHGVVMRRMPENLRLSTMIRRGAPVDDHLRSLARRGRSALLPAPAVGDGQCMAVPTAPDTDRRRRLGRDWRSR